MASVATDYTRDADVAAFVERCAADTEFFAPAGDIFVARAPGRLDVMGGIADYSGSLVLELPLAAATVVAAQANDEPTITLGSLAASELGQDDVVTIELDAIAPGGKPLDYANARALLAEHPRSRWAAYVAGALVVLGHERRLTIDRGLRMLIDSRVPAGKGVASSAALEVAAMQAVCAALGVHLEGEGRELAILCQKVENLVVGAPCGVMDQMTAACGEANRLLALLCQPAEIVAQVALPVGLELWGIDSGIRHEVGGADYGAVRVGAFMGYRIVAELAGLSARPVGAGVAQVDDPEWRGYLANISPAEWLAYRERVPVEIEGSAFLDRYGGITDRVVRVDRERTYAVRRPTEHPILEHDRVQTYRRLLETGAANDDARTQLGELMYASHVSYGTCGLGSSGTDRLVELVRSVGAAKGLYGAKITGGGSGGVVAVLARAGSRSVVDEIAARYARESGHSASVLGGSSAGAVAFGVVRVDPAGRNA
jgi:galactokinase